MEDNVKSRTQKFVQYKGLTMKEFEQMCNLSTGYVTSMRKGYGPEKLNNVLRSFPDLNREWLLFGEGEMIKNDNTFDGQSHLSGCDDSAIIKSSLVLLLPTSAQGGSLNDFVVSVKEQDCEKVVSPIKNVDFAMQVSGDSMAPEYPNGSRVFIKKINEQAFIEWGKAYVLDTCNGTVIKLLVPSDKEGYVRCLSINPDPIFAPFDIALKDIFGIYKVLLSMVMK